MKKKIRYEHPILMKFTIPKVLLLLLLGCLLIATPALAAGYLSSITVTEDGTSDYPMLPMIGSMAVQYMADEGYITDTGLDTRVTTADTAIPHMLANDKLLFCYPVEKSSGNTFKFSTGNEALVNFYLIIGYGGYITIPEDPSIELGNNFIIKIKGWIDTTAGSNKNLLYKADAFRIYVQTDGAIRAAILSTGDVEDLAVTATSVGSGDHIIKVIADGTNLKIFVDGSEKGSTALGTTSVPDNVNNWTGLQNNVMPYMEYLKVEIG